MKKDFKEEDHHITTSRKELINHHSGCLIAKRDVEEILEPLGEVKDIRYILLTHDG